MIVMVGGSRGYPNRREVEDYADAYLSKDDIVIHGDCPDSPDKWFGYAASALGCIVGKFPYVGVRGNFGGHIRNRAMVDMADKCIFFWDGKSSGTSKTIQYALKFRKDVKIMYSSVKK